MGDIVFNARFNTTEVQSGFEKIADSTKAATKTVQTEAKKISKSLNDEIEKVKPFPAPVSLDKVNLVRQLKAEIVALESAAIKAGAGTKGFADAIAEAGK